MSNGIDEIEQWYLNRFAKFTASENYKLLGGGKKGETFGDGAMTYIKTKSMELSTGMHERPELEEVKSLLWGKLYEYPAYDWAIRHTGNTSMKYLGTEHPLFLDDESIPNESGGTPDAIQLSSSATVETGYEIKCPKNSMYHFDRLKWKSQWDVKEGYLSCYTQIQNLIKITGAPVWHFISFDDRQRDWEKKGKLIEVFPDRKFIDNLDLRIRLAVKEKYRVFDEHMNA